MIRNARGQATVELALGLLMFVTVLVFGIHFAEVSYLSTRVQQAAAFSIYDATGQRAHERGKDMSRTSTVPGLATSETRKNFRDFEANRGGDHDARPIRHVFTEIDQMNAQCTLERSITYSPLNINPLTPSPFDGSRGGMACGASATIRLAPGFPRGFFDRDWNLQENHYAGRRDSYTVCATPRASNGQCGRFGLLIGDFSLQGRTESRSNDLFNVTNRDYYTLVEDAFGPAIGCPASQALAMSTAWSMSIEACSFQFSYQGVERNYRQSIRSAHAGPTTWITGGTNDRRTIRDPETYLGVRRF